MAYIRKLKSGKWQATVRHPSGARFTKTDPLKRVVKEWADHAEGEIRNGNFIDPNLGKMWLVDWYGKWFATRRIAAATADKDTSWWRNHIEPEFGSWPVSAIQSWDVEKWVTDLDRREVGAETVASSLRLLRQVLDAAVKHKVINANPAAGIKAPPVPRHVDRFLSHGEADRLLEEFDGADRLFVETLLFTGLRWSELASLEAFRVDLLRRRIQVKRVRDRRGNVKDPKTRAGVRALPLTDSLVTQLSRHITAPGEALVFTSPQGKPLRYANWLRRVWHPAVARAGLADPQPTPHDCRHTYGSWLADRGVPPHEIAALMGHASLQSVQRYLHASEARMDRAVDALEYPQNQKRPHAR